jgi:hypothetical protein
VIESASWLDGSIPVRGKHSAGGGLSKVEAFVENRTGGTVETKVLGLDRNRSLGFRAVGLRFD